ncbi:MAG: hypothetical protein ACK4UP_10905 [Spirosomataceae bacterium]
MKKFYKSVLAFFFLVGFSSCEVSVTTPKVAEEVEGTYSVSQVTTQETGKAAQTLTFSGKEDSPVQIRIERASSIANANALLILYSNDIPTITQYISISRSANKYSGYIFEDQVNYELQIVESELSLVIYDDKIKLEYFALKL